MGAFLLTPLEPGDANGDGRVDINDLTIVLANFGQTGMAWSQGDFTGDPTVDINDLTIVLSNYGYGVRPPPASMPSPNRPPSCCLPPPCSPRSLVCAFRRAGRSRLGCAGNSMCECDRLVRFSFHRNSTANRVAMQRMICAAAAQLAQKPSRPRRPRAGGTPDWPLRTQLAQKPSRPRRPRAGGTPDWPLPAARTETVPVPAGPVPVERLIGRYGREAPRSFLQRSPREPERKHPFQVAHVRQVVTPR